jgi:hypothetical protein
LRASIASIGAALAASLAATPAAAAHKGWKQAADAGALGLMSTGLIASAVEHDGQGAEEFAFALGSTLVVTEGLKATIHEERPDRSNDQSFPSGHTSAAFASAAYLQRRYGWQVGFPATLVAGLVGVARVESKNHHWYDVAAGAAIGEASAYLFVRPRDDRVVIVPWGDTHGGGLMVSARF